MSLKCQLYFNRLKSFHAPPTSSRGPRPPPLSTSPRCESNHSTFILAHRPSAVSAPLELSLQGLLRITAGFGSKMKRSHNYSSSDSDLDDNIEVEKDSGDENGYVHFFFC